MKQMSAMALVVLLAAGCHSLPLAGEPPVERLRSGMTLEEFQTILNHPGQQDLNPSIVSAVVDFDFDGLWVTAGVKTDVNPPVVEEFVVRRDNLKADQRKAERLRRWAGWAEEIRNMTNGIPNK